MKRLLLIITLLAISSTSVIYAIAADLDFGEETHLVFMREEEKLARDVYLTLSDIYPNVSVFSTIGENSEQTHTDTVRDMLVKHGITDPNPDANNLPDSIGVFTGADYGWYFTEKFAYLTTWGSESVLDALYVGAFIEELDMLDIVGCPKVIVETDNGIGAGECGLTYTDEPDLQTMYTHLVDGSKDHLRAYVKNIENFIGVGNYVAQVLTQEEVDEILGR
ncbi:MAG: DUF2202 domain-containing protein [Gammaproteobacteria bacterium]|nr:DUF2202 domain-containing protein [Gammaproteobacteria bacterium]MBU1716506.1 DUF2202 domain-containing protein [Pseudomonadota bacterium]